MKNLPHFGDHVKVWPAAGVRVQDGAEKFGHFLATDGREVIWDVYWHRRFLEGAIHLHDPEPATPAPPVPAKAKE